MSRYMWNMQLPEIAIIVSYSFVAVSESWNLDRRTNT